MRCPKCGNERANFIPWLGIMWECKKCGYRGPLGLSDKKIKITKKEIDFFKEKK